MRFIKEISAALYVSLFVISCSKDDVDSTETTSNIMLIHTSPDAPALDVYADTSKINSIAVSYSDATAYLPVVTGNKAINVKQAGSSATLFSTAMFPFERDKSYSLFIVDSLSNISAIRLEDNLSAPASGKTNFRILHLSPNTANVDFILRSGADSVPITNKTFKQIPDLLAVDGKTYTVKVKIAGTQTVIATATGLTLNSGKVYTLFLKGFSGGIGPAALGVQLVENN